MTSSFTNRRGSALLIVLGMLSFMLFSGLAFSVYMRYSRLPTSFLRRTSTTRQLAKAALAEAIDHIDLAIGNDPHPGVPSGLRAGSALQNIWSHRVFVGQGSTGGSSGSGSQAETDSSGRFTPSFSSAADTVPTLTLEGLAYLPPNLINEARYYSQLTPTAKWHSFWFDSGRYAYTAIDVSDYFDVNRIQANKPRASCPSRRISFAHLFEEGAEHTASGKGATQWDSFMDKYRSVNDETCEFTFKDYPFVSMADFNIAWGSQEIGGLKCPFYSFLSGSKPYDCGETAEDPEAEKYRGMTFVTDGWYPTPKKTGNIEVYDLESKQPFRTSELEGNSSSYNLDHVMESSSDLFDSENYFAGRVCGLSRVALWDYLDEDKCPLSLALPTCEQVPMICGIQPEFAGMKFAVKTDPSPASANDAESRRDNQYVWYKRIVKYYMVLDALGGDLNGKIAWAYPFLLKGQEAKTLGSADKFNLDGKVAIYLTDADGGGIPARPSDAIPGLFLKDKNDVKTGDVVNETVVTYPFEAVGLSNVNPKDIFTSASAGSVKGVTMNADGTSGVPVQDVMFRCDASKNSAASSASGKLMVTVTYEWRKKKIDKEGNETTLYAEPEQDPEIKNNTTVDVPTSDGFGILAKNGKKDTNFDFIKDATATRKVKVNVAVWARVTDAQKNKSLDLVPACLKDDELNSLDNTGMGNKFGDDSPAYPLLAFEAGEMELSLAKFNAKELGEFSVSGQALITGDPRYNHAPENWNLMTGFGADSLSMHWYEREAADASGKDGDIYMATSDQARMQSVYELMMLPRLQDKLTHESSIGFTGAYSVDFDGNVRGAGDTLKDRAFMWRTYNMGDFDELGDGRIVSGGNGMKVNPYTDSAKVMMAAFANTPYNWRLASDEDDELYNMDVSEFNQSCAWNGYSKKANKGSATICWEHLENLAGAFQDDIRDQSIRAEYENYIENLKGNNRMVPEYWSYVFRRLGWSSDSRYLLSDLPKLEDGEDTDLFSVDKKFLYGFWHDCFAARQQLFLIFVRAEPMMMGGGVKGQVPPQLGARAVALVWRDPAATTGTRTVGGQKLANPHRTRILFYHQFD